MATITVRGQGTAPARPDEVEIVLEVAAVHDEPADAFSEVVERANALEAVCDELGIPESARRTTGVSVHDYQEYEPGGTPVMRRRAVSRLSLRFEDLDPVPSLLRAAVERAQARVEGPLWRLADENPARLEACRKAVLDARRRAEAYADALGRRLGALERVADAAVAAGPVQRGLAFASLEPELPVHSPELEAAALVDVTYALEGEEEEA